ncbi:hypothetical protein PHLGIDRAFT_70673 [Phlebiopsis gigantea 11061_1 CR5-6]|uniref:tRNA(His) guanylyltransferase n=1 Tax=Phlebiopsis gigantea (strain 11061_1 CR5-6) TaxID=745531 RepID=A0A0C3RZ96_PHLG1|nr:hypothetical protein PHLGIDRAFT_70673 [Phlebiopsis gigantea 11061_1 CR5-6]
MAGTKFAYVKSFELPDVLLPGTYILVRLDGHGFHRLSQDHNFSKPNDERALRLMDHAARDVLNEFKDIVIAFGESDEYRLVFTHFLFRKSTQVYNRRHAKIVTTVTSLFTSSYVFNWSKYMTDTPLQYPPSFDGRAVLYPSPQEVRDYFSWRQADTHINNLYNTTFWALVQQDGQTPTEAHAALRGTVAKTKQELLFSRYGTNYNSLPERYRKGSVLTAEHTEATRPDIAENSGDASTVTPATRAEEGSGVVASRSKSKKSKVRTEVVLYHCDIIDPSFWGARPRLLQ